MLRGMEMIAASAIEAVWLVVRVDFVWTDLRARDLKKQLSHHADGLAASTVETLLHEYLCLKNYILSVASAEGEV
jgi:hypothetical protein